MFRGTMMDKAIFNEVSASQRPAIELLAQLGYNMMTFEQSLPLRDNLYNPILTDVLRSQLIRLNQYEYKGNIYKFSEKNIEKAIRDIDIPITEGLISANEKIYDRLMLGTSYEEITNDGNRRSFNMYYIDWGNIKNNIFHAIPEYEIERADGRGKVRPDIVLFINGIPIGVIENKRPSVSVNQAIDQMIRNQKKAYIPQLFKYTQLLMAMNKNEVKYATTGTPRKFWSVWHEEELDWLTNTLNKTVQNRKVTKQDQDIVSLCSPERLLEFIQFFILFDKNVKKIARYQQYFGVKEIARRVEERDEHGNRKSGVIWHTQGSGKSLTMVMFSKYIFSHLREAHPKVIVVTDRVDLDNQIYKTFQNTSLRPNKATTGRDLVRLINDHAADIITTIVNKFVTAADHQEPILSKDIFILVDESHRTQYGKFHSKMRRIFPNASYLGFTGTPLMKKEKNTMMRFGELIHTYTISDAVRDKTILPLYYEGLMVEQEVNQEIIDRNLDLITQGYNEEQKRQIKQQWSSLKRVSSSEKRIQLITTWIVEHFKKLYADTGFTGMLATSSKADAVRYLEQFEFFDQLKAKVIISPPDTREGHDDVDKKPDKKVLQFWNDMMDKYGDERTYEDTIKEEFIHGDFDILIVVDKLLTGFDAPRAAVMYVDKSLKEHNLLQAIARVNRLYEGKDRGLIVDFRGLLTELDSAMNIYSGSGLENFDPKDLEGTLIDSMKVSGELREAYTNLNDLFKHIKNKQDSEAYEKYLADQKVREDFYAKLRRVETVLKYAISSVTVYQAMEEEMKQIEKDVKFYRELRKIVRIRYADTIDMSEINPKMQKLIDQDITSTEVTRITRQIDLTNKEQMLREIEELEGEASKADAIRTRLSQRISKSFEKDPSYYKKFSEMIEETFNKYKEQRISEKEYLEAMYQHIDDFEAKDIVDYPDNIKHDRDAKAYYGMIYDTIIEDKANYETSSEEQLKNIIGEISLEVDDVIHENIKVDWEHNEDVKNQIEQGIEDVLYDYKEKYNLSYSWDEIDKMNEELRKIALKRHQS